MNLPPYSHLAVMLALVPIAGCFLSIGLRGVFADHPFVVSGRWVLLCAGSWAVAQFGWVFKAAFNGHLGQQWPFPLIGALTCVVVVCLVLHFGARGYWAYGVTATSLHDGLRAALSERGLRDEAGFGGVYVVPTGTCISISVHDSQGIARLKTDRFADASLRRIVDGMNRYYASSSVTMIRTACILYVAAGVSLLGCAGWALA